MNFLNAYLLFKANNKISPIYINPIGAFRLDGRSPDEVGECFNTSKTRTIKKPKIQSVITGSAYISTTPFSKEIVEHSSKNNFIYLLTSSRVINVGDIGKRKELSELLLLSAPWIFVVSRAERQLIWSTYFLDFLAQKALAVYKKYFTNDGVINLRTPPQLNRTKLKPCKAYIAYVCNFLREIGLTIEDAQIWDFFAYYYQMPSFFEFGQKNDSQIKQLFFSRKKYWEMEKEDEKKQELRILRKNIEKQFVPIDRSIVAQYEGTLVKFHIFYHLAKREIDFFHNPIIVDFFRQGLLRNFHLNMGSLKQFFFGSLKDVLKVGDINQKVVLYLNHLLSIQHKVYQEQSIDFTSSEELFIKQYPEVLFYRDNSRQSSFNKIFLEVLIEHIIDYFEVGQADKITDIKNELLRISSQKNHLQVNQIAARFFEVLYRNYLIFITLNNHENVSYEFNILKSNIESELDFISESLENIAEESVPILQMPLEQIAEIIFDQYYRQPFVEPRIDKAQMCNIYRLYHGVSHAGRVVHHIDMLLSLYKTYMPNKLTKITDNTIKLIKIVVLMHDAGRQGEGKDQWEHHSYIYCQKFLECYGVSSKKAKFFARLIKYKDDPEVRKNKFDDNSPIRILLELLHDADCLDVIRVRSSFDKNQLYIYRNFPETRSVIDGIVDRFKDLLDDFSKNPILYEQGDSDKTAYRYIQDICYEFYNKIYRENDLSILSKEIGEVENSDFSTMPIDLLDQTFQDKLIKALNKEEDPEKIINFIKIFQYHGINEEKYIRLVESKSSQLIALLVLLFQQGMTDLFLHLINNQDQVFEEFNVWSSLFMTGKIGNHFSMLLEVLSKATTKSQNFYLFHLLDYLDSEILKKLDWKDLCKIIVKKSLEEEDYAENITVRKIFQILHQMFDIKSLARVDQQPTVKNSLDDILLWVLSCPLLIPGVEFIEQLIRYGGNPNIQCSARQRTALIYAIYHRRKDLVEFLLNQDVDINSQDCCDKNALMYAVQGGQKNIVELLISKRANLDLQDINGMTVLMYAVRLGYLDIVKFLIEQGTDRNLQDYKNRTALMYAVRLKQKNTVELLVDSGAKIDLQDHFGRNALMYAILLKQQDIVEFLIDRRADIMDLKDQNGLSALIYAIRLEDKSTLQLLVNRGANKDALDDVGMTPLMHAIKLGYEDIVIFLIEQGANIDLQDYEGKTALMHAIKFGCLKMIKILIKYGAREDLTDNEGKNALIHARGFKRKDIAALLIRQDIDEDFKNEPCIITLKPLTRRKIGKKYSRLLSPKKNLMKIPEMQLNSTRCAAKN